MTRTTYFAVVDVGYPAERPAGLVRRVHTEPYPTDESLGRDMQWQPTAYIRLEEMGRLDSDLVEIDEAAANALIERWSREEQPGQS